MLLMSDTQRGQTASGPVVVRVFAPPPAPGCAEGKTWESAAEVIFRRLAGRFGSQVAFEFIQLFSPEFFRFTQVIARLQDGSAQVPIITVDDEIVQSGGKISERSIREDLEARGLTVVPTP
jgi:disulfide oxidoreductase YuzD